MIMTTTDTTTTTNPWPNLTQQRALAYASKPFAALSFVSSLFVLYYLLIRHPEKTWERMYHRLILSTFCCILPLSFCIFWGTWAMPAESVPWAVGASGTSITCSIQGFLIGTYSLAFPFYYASMAIFANVALKNNFKEEKYVWMEKWIHFGAYALPLSIATYAAVTDLFRPGLSQCIPLRTSSSSNDCEDVNDPSCAIIEHTSCSTIFIAVIGIELLVGTCAILHLLWKFDAMQKEVDCAVGMKQLVEKARKQRHFDAAVQTGLYLASFWFGYIPSIVESSLRLITGKLNYELIVVSECIFASQGMIITGIYFLLQRRSEAAAKRRSLDLLGGAMNQQRLPLCSPNHDTVMSIRANAARPLDSRRASSRRSSKFSFHIFDGTPAEDSPWRRFLDEFSDESVFETVADDDEDENESVVPPANNNDDGLATSLLSQAD